jgi:hypothetical protein
VMGSYERLVNARPATSWVHECMGASRTNGHVVYVWRGDAFAGRAILWIGAPVRSGLILDRVKIRSGRHIEN